MNWVILDRDGVINHDSDDYIKSPSEWNPIPGSLEAIARLNRAGFKVVVATNQSGLARGLFTPNDLEAIHQKMQRALMNVGGQLAGIFICPHGPHEGCLCRKPAPGLLWQIREHMEIELQRVPIIGDALRDIESAQAVGAEPILVETGKGDWTRTQHSSLLTGIKVFTDLAAAADNIIAATLNH